MAGLYIVPLHYSAHHVHVHSPFSSLHLSSLTAPQMCTHSSTISFEEFIFLSPGYHVLLLSVVLHATMIMCVLVRLLTCQLWTPVIVMDSIFMQKGDWISLQASVSLTSYIRMWFQSHNPVFREQNLVNMRTCSYYKLEIHHFILSYTWMTLKAP